MYVLMMAMYLVIFLAVNKNRQQRNTPPAGPSHAKSLSEIAIAAYSDAGRNEAMTIGQMQARDPYFSEQVFEGWVKDVFLTLNEAWMARDIDRIRPLETPALFSEHSRLLQQYIDDKQINRIEKLGISDIRTHKMYVDAYYEYLEVAVKAHMIDYVINEDTKEFIRGDKDKVAHMIYTLVFARTLGTLSTEDGADIRTTDCPSCGAPIQMTAGGRCEFCRSVLETNKHGWVLCSYTGQRVS